VACSQSLNAYMYLWSKVLTAECWSVNEQVDNEPISRSWN